MEQLLERYGTLLGEVDVWFQRCHDLYPAHIACHNGCSACCRGLFDVTLLDALYLKRGFDRLPEAQKTVISAGAGQRLHQLSRINPAFGAPWLLNSIPEEEWDELMPEEDETPCLLLSPTGGCLAYDHRPMTCRLNGIPLIDISGEEMFDEWCTLNFTGDDPRHFDDIRFAFVDLFTRELILFQEMMELLTGRVRNEADLFIPAALVLDPPQVVVALSYLP